MIGIIGAMDIEVENIKALLSDTQTKTISGVDFVYGNFGEKSVVVAKCGVGKVFAALCAEAMILSFDPSMIINVGVGGCLTSELKIGDIVLSESVVQHDMDTSPLGDPVGLLSGINIINIPSNDAVRGLLEESIKECGINYKVGVIATGDQFVADSDKKAFIKDNFDAISCEMEGASIGHVCYINKVPFCVLRAMSDGADDGATMDYPEFCRMAANNEIRVIKNFLSRV